MTQTTPPPAPSAPSPAAPPPRTAGLARLRKMSTTAGVGLGEYRAVNGLAVTSLVLGVASWMSWLHPLLFLLPVLALVLGVMAMVQIRRSQGTQSGVVLAGLGILLGLCLGGWSAATEVIERRQVSQYQQEINQLAADFGAALAEADYERAYELTDVNFRREVTLAQFQATMASDEGRLGGFTGGSSNGRAQITTEADGPPTANALLVIETGGAGSIGQAMNVVRRPDGWRIYEFAGWFRRR